MGLKENRKGVVSLVDAMIFVTLISVVSVSMFSFVMMNENEEPMAKTVCEEFISIELKASDVFDTEDSEVYDISTLIASQMTSGHKGQMEEYVEKVIDELIPKTYGFRFEITTEYGTLICEREGTGQKCSEYATAVTTVADKEIKYLLSIY